MTTMLPVPPATMHAAMIYAPGDVRYEQTPTPQPGPGEILLQVGAALTCGTDLKTYRRGHPVLIKSYPSPFGHECAGTVAAVGEGVTQFAVGDRVVAANSAPCGTCFYCRKNHVNLCENLDLLNGAYAQYLKIPARIVAKNTLPLPAHVPFQAAAFAEPLSVCLRGIDACRIQPGDRVAVIGLGAIGLFMARLAKAQGAHVTGFGRNALKRRMAESFSQADTVIDMTQEPDLSAVRQRYTPDGYGFDVVIEAVGLPEMWEAAIALVRRGGLVNLFGGCARGTRIELDTARMHYDEITLISLFHHTPDYFRKALDWIATGQIDPTELITDEAGLPDVVASLEAVSRGDAIKVLIHPD